MINLVHQTGVGGVISFHNVTCLWNLPEENCVQLLTKLDSMGLVMFTYAAAGNTKASVKVHSVISQYLTDSQVYNPPAHMNNSQEELLNSEDQGQQTYSTILLFSPKGGVDQASTSDKIVGTPEWCLTTTLHNLDKYTLPYYIKDVLARATSWATHILDLVEYLYSVVCSSPKKFPNFPSLVSMADELSTECQSVIMEGTQNINQTNEKMKAFLRDRNYDSAREVLEQYVTNASLKKIGLRAKDLSSKVLLHCDQKYKESIVKLSDFLYCFTPEYDYLVKLYLPQFLLCINMHQKITTALASDPSTMEEVAEEVWPGKMTEQSGLLNANYMIKLQEVAPYYVSELAGFQTAHTCHACAHTSSEV